LSKKEVNVKKILGVILVLLLAVSFLAACGEDKPAEFELSSVTVSPSTVTVNDTVTIKATVTNVGEVADGCDVSLTINGYTDSKSISSLAGDESSDVSFSYTATSEGSYTVTITTPNATASKSFTVRSGEDNVTVPVWYVGDSWVYDCSYENPEGAPKYATSELNVTVVPAGQEEGVNEASYHLSGVFTPEATRDSTHPPIPAMVLHIGTAGIWNSVAHINFLKQSSAITELPGMPASVTWSYASPAPSWTLHSGDTWTFTKHTLAGGGMVDITVNRQGKVLEIVDVTVPAGTFSCLHIVEYDPASPDTYTYEHWLNATVVKSDVKMIDRDTWDGAETRVLVSYSVS
jgi:hypothetical protein